MAERLFLFVQLEFPWPLDPPDGRYLLRSHAAGEPENVVVLATLGPGGRSIAHHRGPVGRRLARHRAVAPEPEPQPVASSRATIVDPVSLSAERQAKAWLADLEAEHEVPAALAVLNRLLYAQRIATADPYVRELSASQALCVRAGWGEGEQVAEGRWLHAVELPLCDAPGRGLGGPAGGLPLRRRSAALRPHERLARLIGARETPLLCEELSLRTRLDLDQGRLDHAALELDRAYAAALAELANEQRGDLPLRLAELDSLREGVRRAARAVLAEGEGDSIPESSGEAGAAELDEEALSHALARLEAVLRARAALGFEA
ncbi:MAG TPA: hypothetical protein VMG62_00665 [Solirubrobacteraceae bacterium]|nr:hypothetical protein [Solirubrobacteraceae bacterium]